MKALNVFGISYYVRRLFREDKVDKTKVTREGAPSREAVINVAAETQDLATAHAQDVVNDQEPGGNKDKANRKVVVTGVTSGIKGVHVYVAPPAKVVEDASKVFTQEQVDEQLAEAKKGLFTEADVNAKIAEAMRATPPAPAK